MRRTLQLALRARPSSSDALGAALLGSDHPLVRASELLQSVLRQWVLVAAVFLGAAAAGIAGEAWAWPLILGAGIVFSVLTLLIAGFRQCKHDQAIDLILKGYQNVPIEAIQDQRRRLLSTRTRSSLARHFEEMIDQVQKRPTLLPREARPLFHPRTVAGAIEDLLAVARALESNVVSAAGVARAERMITDGASPLYGHDVIALHAELRRVHHDLLTEKAPSVIGLDPSRQAAPQRPP